MPRAFIGVGSNIEPERNIRDALRRLAESVRIVSVSTFYQEPAIGRLEDPDFYNGVIAIETDLPPRILKNDLLRGIEAAVGRRRNGDKYGPRPIDLDLLLYGDVVLSSPDLTLPDPDIFKRAFIAIPLQEIEPDLVLPDSGLPIGRVVEELPPHPMQPLPEFTGQLRQLCDESPNVA